MAKLIGSPIDYKVMAQLQKRSNAKKGTRNIDEIHAQYSSTAWARLSSGVLINGDNEPARQNILAGGVLYRERDAFFGKQGFDLQDLDKSMYEFGPEYGPRPLPGIDSIAVKTLNALGTSRKTEVQFRVWSLDQLEVYEKLYMRPGFNVLLEYGHSVYLDNVSGDLVTDTPTITEFLKEGPSSPKAIAEKIEELQESTSYNYDAIFGIVMNFQYTYNVDGGYDCVCVIISKGSLLESIKAVIAPNTAKETNEEELPTPPTAANKLSEADDTDSLSPILSIMNTALATVGTQDDIIQTLTDKHPGVGFKQGIDNLFYLFKASTPDGGSEKMVYMKMHTLMKIVNSVLVPSANEEKIFSINYDTSIESKFVTYDNHFSLDPGVCILPKSSNDKNLYSGVAEEGVLASKQSDDILDIWVNISYIVQCVLALKTENESNQSLADFLFKVLDGINSSIGGVNMLDMHYDEYKNTFYVVDRNVTPAGDSILNATIPAVGENSIVKTISLGSTISNEMASMMAIAANASGKDMDEYVGPIFKWNKDLTDKFKVQIEKPNGVEPGTPSEKAAISKLGDKIKQFSVYRQYDKGGLESLSPVHKQITAQNISTKSDPVQGRFPFNLTLTFDGISGLRMGQAFRLQEGVLPSSIQNGAGFIIKSLDHNIQDNKWETTISAYMFLGDKKPDQVREDPKVELSQKELDVIENNKNSKDPN